MQHSSVVPPPPSTPVQQALHQHLHRPLLPTTAVSLVCSAHALPTPLVPVISAFLTDHTWTIEDACELGNLELLQRLIKIETLSAHPLYQAHVFGEAVAYAVKHENAIELLEALRAFSPTGFIGQGMAEAALLGKIHLMEWFVASHEKTVWSPVYAAEAAGAGHLEVLQWLKEHDPDAEEHLAGAIRHAARDGRFAVVKWLYENVEPDAVTAEIEVDALCDAVEEGDLAMAKLLYELRRHQYEEDSFDLMSPIEMAVTAGDLELAELVHKYVCKDFDLQEALCEAARKGSTDTVRWLIENSPTTTNYDEAFLQAVENGHLETAQFLRRCRLSGDVYRDSLSGAAGNGHFNMTKWVFRNLRDGCGSPAAAEQVAVGRAAGGGHFEIVQWLHAHRAESGRPQYDWSEAAAHGNLDIIEWLVENSDRVPHSIELDFAVECGDLEVVRWLHENTTAGCSESAMDTAAEKDQLEILEWLHANRTEGCSEDALCCAAKEDNLEIVQWLHENRTERGTTEAMDYAPSFEMTEWLHWNRSEGCTRLAMDNAAERGDVETLLFLNAYRSEGCTIQAAVNAHFGGHMALFEWLVETYPEVMKLDVIYESVDSDRPDFMSPLLEELDRAKHPRVRS
ncbi:hypothetical protein Gpo141_00011045 [Globisporangium polare]